MALTLDATLAAAQDSITRRPLCEIVSSNTLADIPFAGQLLASAEENEFASNTDIITSGRLINLHIQTSGGADNLIVLNYTDTERTVFSTVSFQQVGSTILSCDLCELTDGNVGLIWAEEWGVFYRLRAMVINPTGSIVTAAYTIEQWAAATNELTAPSVIKLQNNTYLASYGLMEGVNNWGIGVRSSADFASWGADTLHQLAGLNITRKINNASLLQITTGDIWLMFDYVEEIVGSATRSNAYYAVSVDNGANFGAPVAITNFTDFTSSGEHPVAVQKSAGTMTIAWTERKGSLWMDSSATGWCTGGILGLTTSPGTLSFDSTNQKLYTVNSQVTVLSNILKIDVDTWSIDDCYSDGTTPAISSVFYNAAYYVRSWFHQGDAHLQSIGLWHITKRAAMVLNGEADTIASYYFTDFAAERYSRNVTGLSGYGPGQEYLYLGGTACDATNNRLWCFFYYAGFTEHYAVIGYINLSDEASPYTFHTVVTLDVPQTQLISASTYGMFRVFPEAGLIVLSLASGPTSSWTGRLYICDMETGALLQDLESPTIPYHGLNTIDYIGGFVYGSFFYTAGYGQGDRRGLAKVNVSTGVTTFHRPTWASVDDYTLQKITHTDDNYLVIAALDYGVTLYSIGSDSWELINENSLPGLKPSGDNGFDVVAYNPVDSMIIAANQYPTKERGIAYFSRYGFLRRSYYQLGTVGAPWTFASANPLVQGWLDYDVSIALDPSNSIYAFWTSQDGSELSIKWAKEASQFDLSNYILNGSEVILKHTIDGKPSKLEFTLGFGHLFDPTNSASLYSIYLKKGRILTVRFGELIKPGDVEKWQAQGSFVLTETKLNWRRGRYPTISVKGEDVRRLWEDNDILVSEYFEAYPEDIIEGACEDYGDMEAPGDFDLPVFDNRVILHQQWIDTPLIKMVNEICDRFGYFLRVTVDGKLGARKISDVNAVDHTYTDVTKVTDYSPDDSYSNFVNKILVVGEETSFTDVTYPEERVDSFGGTVGWWQGTQNFTRYFSEDKTRVCIEPRLKVIQSVASIAFQLAGEVSEDITEVDSEGKYCVVTIACPNLISILFALVQLQLALVFSEPDGVDGASTVPMGSLAQGAVLFSIFFVLGSVVNFQFEIYARPQGKIRRSVQAIAEDLDHQAQVGKVLEKKIDDPLCESVSDCTVVANFELMVARLQRNRVRFTKIAHLQDEVGDTIKIPHPYSGQVKKIFITEMTRRYKKPASPGGSDGHFLDAVEGWGIN